MKQLHTEIHIDAPPATVWDILVDLDRYSDWNPFIVEATGAVAVGERLRVRIQPPGRRATTFRPTVTVAEPQRTFEWLGHLGVRGVFDGRHRFQLEPHGSGTRFVQTEQFTGVAVPLLFSRALDQSTHSGFEAMNNALKDRSEAAVRHDR